MSAVYLLASTFVVVFALGLQSQFVNNGHYLGAFVNSLAIGGCNLALYKFAPSASGIEIAAYLAGGPLGIVASMLVYRHRIARPVRTLRGPNVNPPPTGRRPPAPPIPMR